MTAPPTKRRVSVTIDADLMDAIDRLSDNRSAVIEEALRLWRTHKINEQLRQFYQSRSLTDIEFEETWADLGQQQLAETSDAERP